MIEVYAEVVVKLFNIGVTNADIRWPLSVFLSTKNIIISFASEKRDSGSHGSYKILRTSFHRFHYGSNNSSRIL
jgi:hypothetical protein